MSALGYYMYQRNIKYSISMLEEETKSITTEIDHYFKDIISIIDVMAYSPCLKEANESDEKRDILTKIISDVKNNNPGINSISVGYQDNSLLINNNVYNHDFQEELWYKNAIEAEEGGYSVGYFTSLNKGDTTQFILSKAFSKSGEKHGVIAVDCQLSSVYDLLESSSFYVTKDIVLINNKYHVVLTRKPQKIHLEIIKTNQEMFTQNSSSYNFKHQGTKYLVLSQQLSNPEWFLVSKIKYSEISGPILPRLLVLLIILVLITLVVSKIYAKVLGKTIAKPVIEVSSALQSLAKGNRNVGPIVNYPKNEIGVMAKSFNTFLETTELLKADINELTETKADLSYSLSLLNASLESTDDGLLIINNKGIMTKWNQRFLDIWDISEEKIGEGNDAKLMPDIREMVIDSNDFYKTILQVNDDPSMVSSDIIELKNGKVIERFSFPQKVNDTIVGRVWRYRDITQIRQSEALLKDSEEKHRVMFTKTVDAYCMIENGIFIDVNQSAEDILDSPKGWLIGKSPLDISPEYQPDGTLSSEGALEHIRLGFEKEKHSFYWIHTRYDGSEFPAEITLIKIRLKDRDLLLAIWKDITEEKEKDRKLRESERKFRLLFENMTNGFALHEMIYNEEGKPVDYRFLNINPAFEQFTGLSANKIIGKTVKDVLPNTEDYWIEAYGQVASTGKSINYEEYSREFDKYFEVKAFSPEKDKFATIFSDSTSRMKALKELEREKELAQAALKLNQSF